MNELFFQIKIMVRIKLRVSFEDCHANCAVGESRERNDNRRESKKDVLG